MKTYQTKHPDWYYSHYDSIFFEPKRCENDIQKINNLVDIKEKTIREIGAGTGNHAHEILKHHPNLLTLADINKRSIEILTHRFKKNDNIKIVRLDGLKQNKKIEEKITICLYSIVQQNYNNLRDLFSELKIKLSRESYFVFEFIDIEKSKKIYPDKQRNTIKKTSNTSVSAQSIYGSTHTKIILRAKINAEEFKHSATIRNTTRNVLFKQAKEENLAIEIQPLDEFHRRNLAFVKARG